MNVQPVFALILLLILSPFILCAFLFILLFDKQSPLFFQSRIGKDKVKFTIVKLQTMKGGKVTLAGKILRKTGVDELMQLVNIVRGEMGFVGPRPLTNFDIERLEWNTKAFDTRWSVLPGITGLAQLVNVCDKNVSWEKDQEYIQKKSTILDLKIIFRSLLVPILGKKKSKELINNLK